MDNLNLKLNNFFSRFKLISLKKNELILRPEEKPAGVYYIKEGFIRMYAVSDEGEEFTLNIFKPGSYFPMTWAIAVIKNVYFFEAITDCLLYRTPKEDVLNFLKKDPETLFDLTRRILIGLNGTLTRMEYLLMGNAHNRITSTLLLLMRRFGKKEKDKIIVDIPLTHKDIANLAGLTRETTSLELKKIKDAGLISQEKQRFIIEDIEKLEKESFIYKEDQPLPYAF